MSKLVSRRDLDFLLYDWLDAAALCALPRYAAHDRAGFEQVIEAAHGLAERSFATHYQQSDAQEPRFDGERVQLIPAIGAALDEYREAGWFGASQDADLGGLQLPVLVEKACTGLFMGANPGTASYPLLTVANANLLLKHGTPWQVRTFAQPLVEGRWFGTMCLSEPQAGSSLGDIRTRAVRQPDGSWRLTGNKMWISAGEHELSANIVHLVLAKIVDEHGATQPGTRGISLFVVPKFLPDEAGEAGVRNDVALAGLNHKMGYRGTTNCLLNFGEGRYPVDGQAGAKGWLVGAEHQGLACMFHMMNEARIGVGLGATMLGYTSYLHALDYARGRPQGRPASNRDPASAPVPIIQHADVRRMLLASKSYVEGALALNLYCARLVDQQRAGDDPAAAAEAGLLLDILTPIAKSWPSQWCLAASDLAIQVHGGYGYTRDYKVEQFWRDNRLNPIHEGTHGIQALDLLGRKVALQQGAALKALLARVRQTCNACAGDAELSAFAGTLQDHFSALARVAATVQARAATDPDRALANATPYLEAFGHAVIGWIWLEQLLATARLTAPHDADFVRGKRQACRYFFRWEIPKIEAQLQLVEGFDDAAYGMREGWF